MITNTKVQNTTKLFNIIGLFISLIRLNADRNHAIKRLILGTESIIEFNLLLLFLSF